MTLFHTPKTTLTYPDTVDDDYPDGMAVEIGDEVEFQGDTPYGDRGTMEGSITQILPRKMAVKVTYLDGFDITRSREPRRKAATISLADLTFIARSM